MPDKCWVLPTTLKRYTDPILRSAAAAKHGFRSPALRFHLRREQNVILLHFLHPSVGQTVPKRNTYKPALLALLISLLLIAGNAAALHAHQDGLAHYNDCDSCLQIQAQTGAVNGQPVELHVTRYRTQSEPADHTAIPTTPLPFSARAPPRLALSR